MFRTVFVLILALSMMGCVTTGSTGGKSASDLANEEANKLMYKPVEYANVSIAGPELVVLPGEIKSNDATFPQRVTLDNIADYAEMELGKANFRVLERNDLGSLLQELQTAASLGDPNAVAKAKVGKFKSTKWLLKFDVLKAEPVANTQQSFDGKALGQLAGAFIPGVGGAVAQTGLSSAQSSQEAGVWLVGMRYKIVDAGSCEQIGTGYFEEKMEVGSKGSSFMGIGQSQQSGATLNTMVQRLVQLSVSDIDQKWKNWTPPAPPTTTATKKSKMSPLKSKHQ